jgi:xylulokinase
MAPLFAGVDIGTTTLKAGLFDEHGTLIRERSVPHIANRKYGWDGIDPTELFEALKSLIRDAAGPEGKSVRGLAFSSLGETVFPVDDNGPVFHGILWYEQCSRAQFERVLSRTAPRRIREITKLDVSWIYSANKMLKFKDDYPDAYARTKAFLDPSAFMAFMLTGEIVFDLTLACRTQLFDVKRREWSREMADAAEIDMEKLPPVRPPVTPRAPLKDKLADELGLNPGTVVTVAGQDHIAGAFGAGVSRYDQGVISIGTSAGFYSPMPPEAFEKESYLSKDTMSGGYSSYPGGMYALTGMSAGGYCIDWFIHNVMGRGYEALDAFKPENGGFSRTNAMFLPNLRAHIGKLPPGGFTELSDRDTGATLLQSIMEAIAFECKYTLADIFDSKGMAGGMREVVMMGGGAKNEPFVRMLANVLSLPINVHPLPHSSGLLGGAMAAGVASGFFKNHEEASVMLKRGTEYPPDDAALASYLAEKYERHLETFRSIPRAGESG